MINGTWFSFPSSNDCNANVRKSTITVFVFLYLDDRNISKKKKEKIERDVKKKEENYLNLKKRIWFYFFNWIAEKKGRETEERKRDHVE